MPINLNVKAQYNSAARQFPQIAKRLRSLTAQALNATATDARSAAIKAAAARLKLTPTILDRRFTRSGAPGRKRTWLDKRASPNALWARLAVYHRGIPFFQLPLSRWRKEGIPKAVRDKLQIPESQAGPFRLRKGRYQKMVFARVKKRPRRNALADRSQLVVPRLSVREELVDAFDAHVSGPRGMQIFRREYALRIRRALAKAGVQT